MLEDVQILPFLMITSRFWTRLGCSDFFIRIFSNFYPNLSPKHMPKTLLLVQAFHTQILSILFFNLLSCYTNFEWKKNVLQNIKMVKKQYIVYLQYEFLDGQGLAGSVLVFECFHWIIPLAKKSCSKKRITVLVTAIVTFLFVLHSFSFLKWICITIHQPLKTGSIYSLSRILRE